MGNIIYIPAPVSPFTPVKYGALYNWWAATDVRNIAPVGFHVPSEAEWITLRTYLGGASIAGGKLKETGFTYWKSPNTGATNEVGFNGRGAGERFYNTGVFSLILIETKFWTNTEYSSTSSWEISLTFDLVNLSIQVNSKKYGNSLRFIADSGTPTTATGNDGKIYPCVTIGTQTWTAANSAETKFRNGDWITGYDGGVYTPISNANWAALTTEAMCVYDDNLNNV